MADQMNDTRAFEILNRHCEYMDGLSRGQRFVGADNALAAVREALASSPTAADLDKDAEIARTFRTGDVCLTGDEFSIERVKAWVDEIARLAGLLDEAIDEYQSEHGVHAPHTHWSKKPRAALTKGQVDAG